jgi:hypothetical protein
MLAGILAFFLKLLGGSFTGKVLDYLERRADNETEQARIRSLTEQNNANNQADVIRTGMGHKMFWVAWSVAALPLAFWFGWGVLDSAVYNGTMLPDVAKLPPQLKAYADIVWSNIFYTGAGMGAAEVLSRAIFGWGRKK